MRTPRYLLYMCAFVLVSSFPLGIADGQPPQKSPGGPAVKNHARVRAAMAVMKKHAERIMKIRGVVAAGTGLASDGEPVVKVFTEKAGVAGIPKTLDGFGVQVRVTGRVYALSHIPPDTSPEGPWTRPVPIGVSTGHPDITAGTIAARVTDGINVFALSNNHVYANVNNASIGDNVLQPGAFDEGVDPADAIGTLADFEPIRFCLLFFGFPFCQEVNQIDAAVAVTSTALVGTATPPDGYGTPNAAIHAAYGNQAAMGDENLSLLLGEPVQKYGRTTALTTGTVDMINATVNVCYDQGCTLVAQFVDQLVISPGTFSDGGDSGSLVVSQTGNHPVGLLFAGSDTATIANRIDLVLNRFGATIDDGGVVTPVTDVATQAIDVPSAPVVAQTTTVTVTVRNVGNQAVGAFDVTLTDDGVPLPSQPSQMVPGLGVGESADVAFDWMPSSEGAHTLQAFHNLAGDANAENDQVSRTVTVLGESLAGPGLRLWQGWVSTDAWTTVDLSQDYGTDMVVVCTPNYDRSGLGPAMVRVRNAAASSFEVGLARPWFGAFAGEHWSAYVHCMVVRAGAYTVAEHGVKMEAVRLDAFVAKDNSGSWSGVPQGYANSYSSPVVVGQVISDSAGIPGAVTDWSVFWSRGTRVNRPASSTALYVGRHTGQDPTPRPAETLAYIVIEAGSGTMDGVGYTAALGSDTVRGVGNRPPYTYGLSGLSSASTAILSQSGMDGGDGGWPILYGSNPVTATQLRTAVEEDWYLDSERRHTTEQVGYIVFE